MLRLVLIIYLSRHDGGILMIMRGVHNLKKCAWVGEEDSAEQDEDHKDTSNESGQSPDGFNTFREPSITHEYPMVPGESLIETEKAGSLFSKPRAGLSADKINLTSQERKEELDYYINQIVKLSKNRKEIIEGLRKHRGKFSKKNVATLRDPPKLMSESDDPKISDRNQSKLKLKKERVQRIKRYLENMPDNEEENQLEIIDERKKSLRASIYANNSSYEVSNATRDIYLSLFELPKGLTYERGTINQDTLNDTSNEEQRSSFSSSEEALTKCSGLISIMPLYPNRQCHSFSDSHTNKIRYKIPKTGTYYFVFSSDNEIFDSDLYLNMTLQRVVFDTEASRDSCVNKTDCSLAFSFWSHDQAVVEVPEGDWNAAYTLETKCQPRVAVYLFFIFLIPLIILFCAFH